jgi:hypothetical protein
MYFSSFHIIYCLSSLFGHTYKARSQINNGGHLVIENKPEFDGSTAKPLENLKIHDSNTAHTL